ncbi:flavin reductase family protein [Arsenicicoccus sp. oral taxon 190]|uniref:flavin reductase family protein n=1 Tax=Arsenicicoccus sp. oral taxon 190 TaxID=1658671 RepID=UPI00067A2A44|nr:flavin reductase family protein [Arsenicicoccus sp. oral taxon 190]AKT52684.1 reductase [Arsenicicoccus sp. oral taxon 190]
MSESDAVLPEPDVYRRAMGRFATGVAVLTSHLDGVDHAMTANSLTSVSLDPMMLLCCVQRDARFHDVVVEAGVWGASILPASQRGQAAWFATRGRPVHGQLDQVAHHRGAQTGVPLFDDVLTAVECRTTQVVPAGDHSVVIGEVVGLEVPAATGDALTYYRGGYGHLA